MTSKDWIKEFQFLLWEVTVDNGCPEEFVKTSYRFAGFSETHTYSKVLWLFLNILAIGLLVVGSILFIFMAWDADFAEMWIFSIAVLLLTAAYGCIFYLMTFVPPRSASD